MLDPNDSEKFVISNIKFDKEALKFDSLMSSTGRLVHHTLRSISKNQVEDILSFSNSYIMDASKRKKTNFKGQKISARKSKHPFVGVWEGEEDDLRYEYTIIPTSSGFDVSIIDFVDGEELEVSKVNFEGKKLKFEAVMPSTGEHGYYIFKAISADKIEITYTLMQRWIYKRFRRNKPTGVKAHQSVGKKVLGDGKKVHKH
jgi:hypothetical protein